MHALRVSRIGAGAAAWGLSFLLAAPGFRILADPITYPQRYELFARQVADPFVRGYGGVWDGDFMGYRILVPAIAHMARLPAWAAVALIWLAGLLTLTLLFSYLEARTSARTAWLATLGLAMTPLVQGSHIYVGYPDAAGWLIVAALIVWPRAWLWAAGTFLIAFNDERGLVALPLALALVLYDTRHDVPAIVRRALPFATAVAAGLAVALLVRWGIATGAIGGAPLAEGVLPRGPGFERLTLVHLAGLLLAFKAYWVLMVWAGRRAARDAGARAYWRAVLVYTVAAVYASAWVFDFWRGLAALFPLVLLALRLLHDTRAARLAHLLPWLTLVDDRGAAARADAHADPMAAATAGGALRMVGRRLGRGGHPRRRTWAHSARLTTLVTSSTVVCPSVRSHAAYRFRSTMPASTAAACSASAWAPWLTLPRSAGVIRNTS